MHKLEELISRKESAVRSSNFGAQTMVDLDLKRYLCHSHGLMRYLKHTGVYRYRSLEASHLADKIWKTVTSDPMNSYQTICKLFTLELEKHPFYGKFAL